MNRYKYCQKHSVASIIFSRSPSVNPNMASILLCYIALASALTVIPDAHGYQPLSENNGRYIEQLYENFLCPFQQVRFGRSVQFGVLTTADNVNGLRPTPVCLHGEPLSSLVNYYATRPDFSVFPRVHVEDQLVNVFNNWISSQSSPSVTDVYILTYHNPCDNCATILSNLADNYPNINFHIGFMNRYGNDATYNTAIEIFQPRQNIFFGEVSQYCNDQSERGDTPNPGQTESVMLMIVQSSVNFQVRFKLNSFHMCNFTFPH